MPMPDARTKKAKSSIHSLEPLIIFNFLELPLFSTPLKSLIFNPHYLKEKNKFLNIYIYVGSFKYKAGEICSVLTCNSICFSAPGFEPRYPDKETGIKQNPGTQRRPLFKGGGVSHQQRRQPICKHEPVFERPGFLVPPSLK